MFNASPSWKLRVKKQRRLSKVRTPLTPRRRLPLAQRPGPPQERLRRAHSADLGGVVFSVGSTVPWWVALAAPAVALLSTAVTLWFTNRGEEKRQEYEKSRQEREIEERR